MSSKEAPKVELTLPIIPDMELAATKTAEVVAKHMNLTDEQSAEISMALIEATINAFEHSSSDSKNVEIIKTSKGDYITHAKFEAHTYKCTSDSGSLMVFTEGVRGGKFYEDDTYRLEKKLI